MKKWSYCLVFVLGCLFLKWLLFSSNVATPYTLTQPEPAVLQTQDERLKQEVNKLLKSYEDNYPRCTDLKSVTNASKTMLELKGADTVSLGGSIRLTANLFDGYGKAKTVGGDHLRARLFTKSLNAYTVGSIYDHENGTYSINFTAYWSGPATAEIEVVFPKEIIAAALYTRGVWDFSDMKAMFRNHKMTESTLCSTNINDLQRNNKNKDVCDFSYWNEKMVWLCLKPRNRNISCGHLERFERNWANYTRVLNRCENEIGSRWVSAAKSVKVSILPKDSDRRQVTVDEPRTECTVYNTTKLWYDTEPTGYFYKGKWKLLRCKGLQLFSGECLRDKRLYLWGDSTVFQWFMYIRGQAKCGCKLEKYPHWKRQINCYCDKYNLTLIWLPHYIPFINRVKNVIRHSKSLYQQVNDDRRSKSMESILVVHLYAHIQMYSLTFFVKHLVRLRKDIEHLESDDIKLRVFIKLPHTHREFRHEVWMIRQLDIIGYIYTKLIRAVFTGLHHRVVVLNNRDATNAVRNLPLHPDNSVVDGMIRQLLSYFCNMSDVTGH